MSTKIEHYENGNIKSIEVRNEEHGYHNENGPAYQSWFDNGQEEYRSYYINNQAHNENVPAYQGWYENGQEKGRSYYINDQFHNENGPAEQYWYENGQEKGRSYYINGQYMTEEDFLGNQKVKVICEGKTVEISRESAKALNLI